MKITIATGPTFPVPAVRGGAVQRMWHGLAKEFAKRGHEVTILARAYPGQPEHENSDGIRILRWGGYDQGTNQRADLLRCLWYAARAAGRLPEGDIVVTNDFWMPVFAARRKGKSGKVVINANRFPKGQYGLYGGADLVAAASGAVASEIRRQTPKLSGRIKVIPNAIDECFLEERNRRIADCGLGIAGQRDSGVKGLRGSGTGALTILYVGRIHPEKGIEILLQAWRLLRERWKKENFEGDRRSEIGDREAPKTESTPKSYLLSTISHAQPRLRIVGPWRKEQGGGGVEYFEALKQKVEGVEWGEPVFGAEELAKVYDSGDILVYPSQAELGEAMPLAPLEGMARGLPVVVSNLEVFKEYLEEGRNGVQFEHRGGQAAENLANALAKLIKDPELRQKMSKEARATAEKYAPGKVAEMYVQAFEDLLKG